MTYTELVQLIKDEAENTETSFVAHISDFVRLAEEDIYRHANIPAQSTLGTGTCTINVNTFSLPADFLAFDYLYVIDADGVYHMLLPKETSFIYEAYSTPTYRAIPQYYALLDGDSILLGPTPGVAYGLRFQYIYKPLSIVETETSWLGDNASNALFYGSMVNAYMYMKGEDTLAAMYKDRYLEAIGATRRLGEGFDRSDSYRNPPPRDLPPGSEV